MFSLEKNFKKSKYIILALGALAFSFIYLSSDRE